MNQFWPLWIESLPLANSPGHEESDGYSIEFTEIGYGRISAQVFDEWKFVVDVITGHSFIEVYNAVREEYPQARWNPERN